MISLWKDVVGYEGRYSVSDCGLVKSLRSNTNADGLLSIQTIHGYSRVLLYKDKKTKMAFVHRLVWEAFRTPVPKGFVVNHIDHDKKNARLENLELVTQSENIKKALVHSGRKYFREGKTA